jgi:dihydrofolate synthase/folylpolyglutamate synthase
MAANKQQLIEKLLATDNYSAPLAEVKLVADKLEIMPKYPIILVGGTNGKGSTCAFLTTILVNAGYKVGTFTSPHVFDYNERICLNNSPVSDGELEEALSQVITASEKNLGLFKSFVLASHLVFTKYNIDIAVIEVGIGGLNDATNIFAPTISAISSIGIDHCELLGNSIEEIGLNKAGIFRSNQPALIAGDNIPESVIKYAQSINAKLEIINRDFSYVRQQISWDFISESLCYYGLPMPSLRGNEQLNNAALSIAILNNIRDRFPVNLGQIKSGLLQTSLIGRFQVLPGTPQIVLDTAHNPQAIEMLIQNMLKLPFAKHNLAVFGCAKDKDWQQALKTIGDRFDHWYLARLPNERSTDVNEIRDFLLNNGYKTSQIECFDDISTAVSKAHAQLEKEDRLVCFGSFLIVESAYKIIKN